MTENEQERNSESEEAREAEEPDKESEEQEPEEDESPTDSKLVKAYKRKKSVVKKVQKRAKNAVLAKMQVLLAIVILGAVFLWDKVEGVLHWAAGQEEIVILNKTTDNGCLEIVTDTDESFCVDQASYDMALIGQNYLVEETQYSFRLRTVD